MFAKFVSSRNPLLRIGVALSTLWLAACEPTGHAGPGQAGNAGKGVPVALLLDVAEVPEPSSALLLGAALLGLAGIRHRRA